MSQPRFLATAKLLGEEWLRSSVCASGSCVEVRMSSDRTGVQVRDSKRPEGPTLSFDLDEWRAFVAGVQRQEFEV